MKIDNTFKFDQKIKFNDYLVGLLVLVTLYHVMLFIILQILVSVGVLIIGILLPEIDIISRKDADHFCLLFMIASESCLILILSRLGMKRFLNQIKELKNTNDIYQLDQSIAFKEAHLESLFSLFAIFSLGWCFLIGLNHLSFQIVLIVFDGFSLLFIVLFVLIRFLTTKEIRISAIFTIVLTSISFWSIFKGMRI